MEQTLVKTLVGSCDGQCGGEVTLVTDGVAAAYATVGADLGTRYMDADCESFRLDDGSIEVRCGSVHARADEPCSGRAVFTAQEIADAAYGVSASADLMRPIETED